MEDLEPGSAPYLEAFMSGFEFVLLALRGRLAEPGLGDAERARLEALLSDYWHIAEAYHARRAAVPPPTQELARNARPLVADLPPVAAN